MHIVATSSSRAARTLLFGARLVAAGCLIVPLIGPAPSGASAPMEPARSTPPASSDPVGARIPGIAPGTYRITLITGDRVTVDSTGAGRFSVEVEVAPRSDGSDPIVEVEATKSAGGAPTAYAIPSDAQPYIASGQLDRELFNIGYLIRNEYALGRGGELPVIVEYDDTTSRTPVALSQSLPSVEVDASLGSIDAAANMVHTRGADDLWSALISGGANRAAPDPSLGHHVESIRLDRQVRVALDESVPQIGAPDAWEAGLDGTGVDVAVLDTGIDLAHPDVAGKVIASRSFVEGETVDDGHGHGTHVASIVAGTGAASDGRFTGVAPGAALIVGKVLANNGRGSESDVIDAMEWAAQEQDADVVNVSLGSIPTDGTDPASQAVDALTASAGALFVVAAGNLGPRTYSVASPATADAALTVGAVDGAEQLASFSSRGPRVGDYAIKPEITAPGVSTTAARAAGTRLGPPFDDYYVTASGTSMATPHVAGAAAILAQQHPDWSPGQLKAGLVATAVDGGHTVYQQGSGRVDVAHAIRQQVQVSPATSDFGQVPVDDEASRTRQLTYTNPTPEPVTLDVAARLSTVGGKPTSSGAVSLSTSTVTVPAGGSASVTVTLDPSELDTLAYTGDVVARVDGVPQLRTPLGVVVGEHQHTLDVDVTAKQGVDAFDMRGVLIFGVDGEWAGESISCGTTDCPADLSFRLADGTYSIRALASWNNAAGVRQLAVLVDPEVHVDADTSLELDANAARRMTVSTQRPTANRTVGAFGLYRSSSDGAFRHINGISASPTQDWWVTPTERVREGDFAISSHWTLTPSTPSGESPAYVYALKLTEWEEVPDSLAYRFRDRDLVHVDNRYHADQPGQPLRQVWFTWAPWEFFAGGGSTTVMSQTSVHELAYPGRSGFVHERSVRPIGGGLLDETFDVYLPRSRHVVEWHELPNTPGATVVPDSIGREGLTAPLWWWVCPACRQGDNLYPFIHLTSSGVRHTLGQYGRPFGFGEIHLYRDGVEITQSPPLIGAFTTYALSPEPASYRLTLDDGGSSTAWEFPSARPEQDATPSGQQCLETVFVGSTAPCAPQPLLFVRYDAGVGIDNRVAAGSTDRLEVDVYRADGVVPKLEELRVWLSTDDGADWRPVTLTRVGATTYRATVRYPDLADTSGQVSLRVAARDTGGSSIEQTVIGAYGLRG